MPRPRAPYTGDNSTPDVSSFARSPIRAAAPLRGAPPPLPAVGDAGQRPAVSIVNQPAVGAIADIASIGIRVGDDNASDSNTDSGGANDPGLDAGGAADPGTDTGGAFDPGTDSGGVGSAGVGADSGGAVGLALPRGAALPVGLPGGAFAAIDTDGNITAAGGSVLAAIDLPTFL